ncbi:MAG: DUF3459 domain-containing protein, partial [Anaerolineae bacterium]|nr:DUF3459 domain-containing protein [Anaerolineae bacterium]
PAPDGGPPTNWLSHFDGKSAWTWDEVTQQYYLHSFLAEQPDVNWRNPELKNAMLDVLRFWLDRGVDGFRIDVAHRIIKDDQLRDNPPNPNWRAGMDPFKALTEEYTRNRPELHPIYREMRSVLDAYPERMMVGEINVSVSDLMHYYGDGDEFHLPFNFQLIHAPWDATIVRNLVDSYEAALPDDAWPNWVLGNHDQHRFASRTSVGQARVGMMLLLTLRGTPTIYYGEEIGMQDGDIPPERVQDPWEKNVPGLGLGRDPERTPMQWDDSPHAGFCPANIQPWLPVADTASLVYVAAQKNQPQSILSLTRHLIELRQTPALLTGAYRSLPSPDGIFAYERRDTDRCFVIVLNFTDSPQAWDVSDAFVQAQVLLSTHLDRVDEPVAGAVSLRPDEGLILDVAVK